MERSSTNALHSLKTVVVMELLRGAPDYYLSQGVSSQRLQALRGLEFVHHVDSNGMAVSLKAVTDISNEGCHANNGWNQDVCFNHGY